MVSRETLNTKYRGIWWAMIRENWMCQQRKVEYFHCFHHRGSQAFWDNIPIFNVCDTSLISYDLGAWVTVCRESYSVVEVTVSIMFLRHIVKLLFIVYIFLFFHLDFSLPCLLLSHSLFTYTLQKVPTCPSQEYICLRVKCTVLEW